MKKEAHSNTAAQDAIWKDLDLVARCHALSLGDKFVMTELVRLAREYGYCFAENKYFAERWGKSITTVDDHLEKLEEDGFIRRERKNGQRHITIEWEALYRLKDMPASKSRALFPATARDFFYYFRGNRKWSTSRELDLALKDFIEKRRENKKLVERRHVKGLAQSLIENSAGNLEDAIQIVRRANTKIDDSFG